MFTGIVQEIGLIVAKTSLEQGVNLIIKASNAFLSDVSLGDSIAIEGACMTVVSLASENFSIDISAHSLSIIKDFEINTHVNLEKALKESSFLGGHIVSGHVDSKAYVFEFNQIGESFELITQINNKQNISPNLGQFMAMKGSITINGVSLTINKVYDKDNFTYISCNLIPHTINNTTLQYLASNHAVNIEIDLFARYMQRILEFRGNFGL